MTASGISSAMNADDRATARKARMAATAIPTSTARMRSNRTVVAAVTTRMNASPPVERSTARTLGTSTMRTAVTISTPASAASGMAPTGPPEEQHHDQQHQGMDDGRQARPGAGADIHRSPGDGSGRGHAAEQRRRDIGEALAKQLSIRVVSTTG